jgi:pimeloyl-ACP methyl ester carboxylesterase
MTVRRVVLAAAALASAAVAQPADSGLASYADTAASVTLDDGRVIHLTCMGEGAPTVILTAGLGDWGVVWNKVQPAVAKTTRVCAWDRAGFGLSDPSPLAQTASATVADFAQVLSLLAAGPYVLVGHSIGSFETLLYADRHPQTVAGMVLVDPSLPDQWARFAAVAPAFTLDALEREGTAAMRRCAAALREGRLGPGQPDPDGCLRAQVNYPRAVSEALAARQSPERFETMASLNQSAGPSAKMAVNGNRTYGAMPLVVLTAGGRRPAPPGASAELVEQMPRIAGEIERGHAELAALSSRGTHIRVPGASHAIQLVQPWVVVDAIDAVVSQARAATR